MKLFIKKQSNAAPENVGDTQTSYEIPNATIAWGTIILTLVQAIATLLVNYFGNLPKQKADNEMYQLREKVFIVQVLQRVLENSDSLHRANSLKLLIASDIIQDPNGKITEMVKHPSSIPLWDKRPLELLKPILEITSPQNNSNPAKPTFTDTASKGSKPPSATEPVPESGKQ